MAEEKKSGEEFPTPAVESGDGGKGSVKFHDGMEGRNGS